MPRAGSAGRVGRRASLKVCVEQRKAIVIVLASGTPRDAPHTPAAPPRAALSEGQRSVIWTALPSSRTSPPPSPPSLRYFIIIFLQDINPGTSTRYDLSCPITGL